MEDRLLSIEEAAKALNVSKDTIRRRIKKGEIEAQKLPGPYGNMYYIKEEDLATAAEIVDLVTVSRQLRPQEIKEIMQAVIEPLQQEIKELRQEVESLKGEIKQLPAAKQKPWWKRIFNRER
jgi:excisionase family DNA binding protein